jgi:hypothetical protein
VYTERSYVLLLYMSMVYVNHRVNPAKAGADEGA